MADVAPLRAYRYDPATLQRVVAPPYDVIGSALRGELGARSPHNIVHLDLPEGEGDAKYAHAAELLTQWIADRTLFRDGKPVLLRYDQEFTPPDGGPRVNRRGFFALVRGEPYERRVVLPHERTLSGPKEDRRKLFEATRAALSPVFLLYEDPSGDVASVLAHAAPLAEFRTSDDVLHSLSVIEDAAQIARVRGALADRSLLIADGHHRYETTLAYAARVDRERAAAGEPPAPDGAHQFVLAYLADANDPGLVVFPTHRLVHGVGPISPAELRAKLGPSFTIASSTPTDVVEALHAAAERAPSFAAVFPDGTCFVASRRADLDVSRHPALARRPAVLHAHDVAVLHALVLEEALGISEEAQAAQTNLRYSKSTVDALSTVARGEADVLFLLEAPKVADVRRACEAGAFMPQKSTYFYPKVLTGLAIHVLDPDDVSHRAG